MRPDTRERAFWNKVNKNAPNGCWVWTGKKTPYGYGAVSRNGKDRRAHRISYELCKGTIPDGLTIDHLCKNRLCVNPQHLEAVTLTENSMRGDSPLAQKARQTHCERGHPLMGNNLHIRPDGHRHCRQCEANRQRQYRIERKSK